MLYFLLYRYSNTWIRIRIFGIRTWVHKAPEYGSNTDPDPHHWSVHKVPVVSVYLSLFPSRLIPPLCFSSPVIPSTRQTVSAQLAHTASGKVIPGHTTDALSRVTFVTQWILTFVLVIFFDLLCNK